jgi:hypothetical protein
MATEPKSRAHRKLRKRLGNEEADDLRVEAIAAQLEEAEQQRLTDDWIERATEPRRPKGAKSMTILDPPAPGL